MIIFSKTQEANYSEYPIKSNLSDIYDESIEYQINLLCDQQQP